MKLPFSNIQRFFISLTVIFIVAILLYQSFLGKSKKVETYDDLHYDLSSVRVSVTKLEYILDMFVVAGRFEGTTVELIQGDVAKIDESINDLLKNKEYIRIINDNNLLSDGFTSLFDDWQTTKEEIQRLTPSLSQEGLMLLHNAVDMNTVLITEKSDRLLSNIVERRKEAFAEAKGLVFKSVTGFILLTLLGSLAVYKNIISRINAAADTARRISEGDLGARFGENKRSAVGRLSAELNRMLKSVTEFQTLKEEKNMELAAELGNRAGQMEAINSIMSLAGSSLSQSELFSAAARECVSAGAADAAAIYMRDGGALRLKAASGFDDMFLKDGSVIHEDGLNGLASQRSVSAFKSEDEFPCASYGRLLRESGFRSVMCVPVVYDRDSMGLLLAAFRHPQSFIGSGGSGSSFLESVASGIAVSAGHINLFQREFNSKRFLERILHQVPFGIAVFDRNGACLMLNTALRRLLGAEQRFNFIGEYRIFDDDVFSAQGVATSIRKSYEGYSTEFIINYSPSIVSRYGFSGAPRKLKIKSFPLYDAGGEISNIALVFEEVPEAAGLPLKSGDAV